MKTNVVVLGGYGNFGARICRALANDSHIKLIVAARHLERAQRFAESLGTQVTAVSLDITAADFAQQLIKLGAGLVIHTAGPFQGQDWRVPNAVAEAGAHYIDLADGRRWVCDFPAALNRLFQQRGLFAVSGASTVPALSAAVVDQFASQFTRLEAIDICIAPAQQAPRGEATLAAVLSYCGEPISVWRSGRWISATGWAQPQWIEFARMKRRRAALCDIPDLELFPRRYPEVRDVIFRAALEVGITQWTFAVLAALRRWRLLPKLNRYASLLNRSAPIFDRFGTPLGGMVIRMMGQNVHRQQALSWHLTADHHHGPEIPCMAAIILARRIARGEVPACGAYACMGLVSLVEFQSEFARWGMVSDLIEEL